MHGHAHIYAMQTTIYTSVTSPSGSLYHAQTRYAYVSAHAQAFFPEIHTHATHARIIDHTNVQTGLRRRVV
jgi:hypothetical protein